MAKKIISRDNIIAVLLLVIVVLLALILINKNNDNNSTSSSTNSSTQQTNSVTVPPSGMKYPSGWQEAPKISENESKTNVVSRAVHINPPATATIRVLNGPLDKSVDVNKLPAQIVDKLKSSQQNFQLIKSTVVALGRNKAASVTYRSTVNGESYQHSQFIVPTANKTFYLTITAKTADFAKLQKDIDTMLARLADYIANHT